MTLLQRVGTVRQLEDLVPPRGVGRVHDVTGSVDVRVEGTSQDIGQLVDGPGRDGEGVEVEDSRSVGREDDLSAVV